MIIAGAIPCVRASCKISISYKEKAVNTNVIISTNSLRLTKSVFLCFTYFTFYASIPASTASISVTAVASLGIAICTI